VISLTSPAAVSAYFGANSTEYAEAQVYFGGYLNCLAYPGAMLFAQYQGSSSACAFTGSTSTTTLTVTAVSNGALAVGQTITGSGVAAGTVITALGTGTGGAGTYTINVSQTVSSTTMTAIAPGVAAYLRGGSVATLGLAGLQAIVSGTLAVTVDGYPHSAASVNLSTATSFSSAATLLTTALGTSNPTIASFTASITTNVLTVTVASSGVLAVGQTVTGGSTAAGTIITALGTGTGGTGTYIVNISQTVTSGSLTTVGTLPTVTYDTIGGGFIVTSGVTGAASTIAFATGTLAATLLLTSATGAVTSQGAAATTPSAFMAALVAVNQNWASFTHVFDPDGGSGNTLKLAFAAWNALQSNRYLYVPWDVDQNPVTTNPATTSLGYLVGTSGNNYSGTAPISQTAVTFHGAAFVMGYGAALNFNATNGRATAAFRTQSGLTASISSQTSAANLQANGYNWIGAYGNANSSAVFLYNGQVSGSFAWIDSYFNEIWLNYSLQAAIVNAFTNFPSFPYNPTGYSLIEAACAPVLQQFLKFGGARTNVTLSASEVAAVNSAAGRIIAPTLSQQGYFLSIADPGATARANRQTPVCVLWYCDGGAIQSLVISSLLVQ
jgi:hypothetical protein